MASTDKKKAIFDLQKLPDKVYIQELEKELSRVKVERGKDKSLIDELEYNLKGMERLDKPELKELKEKSLVGFLIEGNKELKDRVKTLQRDLRKMIYKKVQIEQELKQLKDERQED